MSCTLPKIPPGADPNAYLCVQDLIQYIRDIETGYPFFSNLNTLSEIRGWYYGATGVTNVFAFSQLIPDTSRYMGVKPPPRGPNYFSSYQILNAHADENGRRDNPSPYFYDGRYFIDFGHLLLAIDALIHPRTDSPYSRFGIPNIDPSNWVADVSIAIYWSEEIARSNITNARFVNPDILTRFGGRTSDFNLLIFQCSAPVEDIIGDIDAFAFHQLYQGNPTLPLSQLFEQFYMQQGRHSSKYRWEIFCQTNFFNYDFDRDDWQNRNDISLRWYPRIERCIDLYFTGTGRQIINMIDLTGFTVVAPYTGYNTGGFRYSYTPRHFNYFLIYVKSQLQAETRRNYPNGRTGNLY